MVFSPNKGPVGIVGLGRSGIAAVHFLVKTGYEVIAWDQKAEKGVGLTSIPQVTVSHDPDPADALGRCQTVLLSPGVPRSHHCLSKATALNIPIINDVEWLYRHSQSQENPAQFIGITGTNGKSTVTTMVGLMLGQAGFNTKTGGNLGQAALSLWNAAVEKFVLELSSFQLESLDNFRPQTAVMLNISPDHLDRYSGIDDYLNTKLNIFARQSSGDHSILNADDPAVMAAYENMAKADGATVIPFSTKKLLAGGFYIQDNQLIDHRGSEPRPLLDCAKLKIAGIHNRANALAAAAIALCAGATTQAVVDVLSTFPGLPHRMEWIKTVDGIPYYNDSKGTNVGAVLQSLDSFPNRLVLIAGGRDKNSDFSPLIDLVEKYVSHIILIGEAADSMATVFTGHCPITRANDMDQAVSLAQDLAKPGETVLLSPACASFDMFKNFEDRGEIFRKAVNEL